MKITINVECTPEEARRYMGLPDVAKVQEAVLKEMQERMSANVSSLQPAELMKAWLPMGFDNWMELQKNFWNQVTSTADKSHDRS